MITKKRYIKFYTVNMKNSYYTLQNSPSEWQLVLFSDGSFTQNVNSITGQKTYISLIKNNQAIREVWIESLNKNKIAFAESYWGKNDIITKKMNNCQPIGRSMIRHELDISKKIHSINYGYDCFIEKAFQIKEPILSREYSIICNGQVLTTIREFFSPNLKTILKNNLIKA